MAFMGKDRSKVFYGNQYIGKVTVDGSNTPSPVQVAIKRGRSLIKRVIKTGAITVAVVWVAVAGIHIGKTLISPVYAEKQVIKEIPRKSPVMARIAQCESGNSHIDKKTGQVVMRANKNGTVDVGLYQINSVWYKKASELGLDITKESDNEAMAMWIYENRGTGDWYSSAKCWTL